MPSSQTASTRKRISYTYQDGKIRQQRRKKERQRKQERWNTQMESKQMLPKYSVHACLSQPIPKRKEIVIYEYQQDDEPERFYGGLVRCGSPWVCSMCAVEITEKRRQELRKGEQEAKKLDFHVYFVTYTVRHSKNMPLADLMEHFGRARRAFESGRWSQNMREKYQEVGSIRNIEVTYGEKNGWHPHVHELIFTRKKIDLKSFIPEHRAQWEKQAQKHGLTMNEHGYRVQETNGDIADYIAKFGHSPDDPSHVWGITSEMTCARHKKCRGKQQGEKRLTPFGMLKQIVKGETKYRPLFIEYAACFKGRRQIYWSPGLKKLLKVEEKTDEELVEEQTEEAVPLISLDIPTWEIVCANDYRGELLELETAEKMKKTLVRFGAKPEAIRIYKQRE